VTLVLCRKKHFRIFWRIWMLLSCLKKRGFQYTTIDSLLVTWWCHSIEPRALTCLSWSWRGKPQAASSARAGLQEANAECKHVIFPYKFAICSWYVVATIQGSRLHKIIGLFCKRALSKRLYSAKETYIFKEPTNHSHPISESKCRTDGSRSTHSFGTCKRNVAARWRLAMNKRAWPHNFSEFTNARLHSICKYH